MLQGHFKEVSRKFQGRFKDASSALQGRFKDTPGTLQGRFKDTSRTLQGRLKDFFALLALEGSFNDSFLLGRSWETVRTRDPRMDDREQKHLQDGP